MGMTMAYGAVDEPGGIAAIRRAHELGVTLFDTAELYGMGTGSNEQLLGRAVKDFRDDVMIATKFGFDLSDPQKVGVALTGVLLTVPIPSADELAPGPLNAALDAALGACESAGITGAAVTPFVLERIEQQTAGASVPANLALAENNARVAAAVAAALTIQA
jgi:hypothetical protein